MKNRKNELEPTQIGELMRQMGFREDAPESLKKAFILNLFRAAYPGELPFQSAEPEQLAFSFDSDVGTKIERRSG